MLGTLFLDPLMRVLGATPTILPYARDYARYILFGAPVMCASFVLNNILRGEGKAMLAMVGIGLGGVLNIGLDPLFIYTFGLGIAGAAIATLLSQCVSFAILLSCFLRRKSAVRLHIGQVSRKAEVYARIIKTGMPSFCRQSLASVATVLLNVNAAVYGDAAVAAMSVVGRIFMFVFSFMLGFGQGFQPVAGYNFGAKRYDRVRGATYFTILVGTVLMAVLLAALLAVRLVKKQKKGLAALGICLGLCVGAGAALYLPRPVLAAGAAGGTGVSVSVLSAQDAFIFAPSTQAQANAEANKAQSEQAAMENEAGTAQTQPAAQMGQVPAEARRLTVTQEGASAILQALCSAARTPTLRENLPDAPGQQAFYVTLRTGNAAQVVCLTPQAAFVQAKTENAVVYRIADGAGLYEAVRAACL